MKFLFLLVLFGVFACQYQQKKGSKEQLKLANVDLHIDDPTASEQGSTSDTFLQGDSLLCSQYAQMASLHKIVLDTMNRNPVKGLRIVQQLHFEVAIEECYSNSQDIYARKLKLDDGKVIVFMADNRSKNALLTVVNQKLFTLRKLFGEMFTKDSDLYFHYDNADIYLLSNGNLLLVEQPSSWCGTANVFDFYQYFDMKKREIIQFVEKDMFINTLK